MPLVDHTVGWSPPVAVAGLHNGAHCYSAVAAVESADTAAVVVAAVAGCQHCELGSLLDFDTACCCPDFAVGTSRRTACTVLASAWARERVPAASAFY